MWFSVLFNLWVLSYGSNLWLQVQLSRDGIRDGFKVGRLPHFVHMFIKFMRLHNSPPCIPTTPDLTILCFFILPMSFTPLIGISRSVPGWHGMACF